MKKSFDDYIGVRRPRKVKHVKFFVRANLSVLEQDINDFADEHPEYKILGVKLTLDGHENYISTITYLEDSKETVFGDYEDDADEERDFD